MFKLKNSPNILTVFSVFLLNCKIFWARLIQGEEWGRGEWIKGKAGEKLLDLRDFCRVRMKYFMWTLPILFVTIDEENNKICDNYDDFRMVTCRMQVP